MTKILVAIFSSFFCLMQYACITSMEEAVELTPTIDEDDQYSLIYDRHTKKIELIDNFETHAIVRTTVLTKSFRKAMSKRYRDIFQEAEPILRETTDKIGFFVVIYTSDEENRDLSNKHVWNVQLENAGQIASPVLIRQLSAKKRWQPFFKKISPWTQEFLIVFNAAPTIDRSKQLQNEKSMSLILSSAVGKIDFSW